MPLAHHSFLRRFSYELRPKVRKWFQHYLTCIERCEDFAFIHGSMEFLERGTYALMMAEKKCRTWRYLFSSYERLYARCYEQIRVYLERDVNLMCRP